MPWPLKWEEDFGFAADRYPVIATEIGFDYNWGPREVNAAYGPAITSYSNRGISVGLSGALIRSGGRA